MNIKREPSVEFELILPPRTDEDNPFGVKKCSVKLLRLNEKLKMKPNISALYNACSRCEFVTTSETKWKDHQRGCRKDDDCCASTDISGRKVLIHTYTTPTKCQLCDVVFKCRVLWLKHKRKRHRIGFECDQCTFTEKSKAVFDRHYSKHTKKFSCSSCDGRFATKCMLKYHQMQHQHGAFTNVKVSFDCDQCEKVYRTPKALGKHKRNSHEAKRLECDFCGKMFSKSNLIRHLESHAEAECKLCGEMIIKSRMPEHVNQEHVEREQSMRCKHCGTSYLNKTSFNQHINAKPLDCLSCRNSFKCRILWRQHLKVQHSEGFKCSQCNYIGKSGDLLRWHSKTHTKKFSCDSCQKKFARKLQLDDHQKNQKHGAFADEELND